MSTITDASYEAMKKHLQECAERGTEPSLRAMYKQGYNDAINDLSLGKVKTDGGWYYIETEGKPTTDDMVWALVLVDGSWYDTQTASYDGKWYLDTYHNAPTHEVVAWHPLPEIPDLR